MECAGLDYVCRRLALIPAESGSWFDFWLSKDFGSALPASRHNRVFSFPYFVEAVYTLHNHIRHGSIISSPEAMVRAIHQQLLFSKIRGLPRLFPVGAAGPVVQTFHQLPGERSTAFGAVGAAIELPGVIPRGR